MFSRMRAYTRRNKGFLKVVTALNSAYLVSALGDRLWAFSMGIIMHRLGGMTWVAIYQLTDAVFKLLLATKVGSMLDRANRNKGIQAVLAANNLCITISAFSFYFLFSEVASKESKGQMIILITAIVFGAFSRVASEAQKTAFTKDWIVVLIDQSKGARLSTQNGIMNMIDQCASFFAPFVAGFLLDNYSGAFCCIIIVVWNLMSWALEAAVLMWIYSMTPELANEKEYEEEESATSPFTKYFRQKAFRAMFGLALLYMTVLGFDNLAISYGASQGMSAKQLGFFRSMGSLLGFLGNGTYAISERFIGVLLTGLIGLTLQNIFINFCSASVFLPGNAFNATGYFANVDSKTWMNDVSSRIFGTAINATSTELASPYHYSQLPPAIIVFFLGITFARFGLWLADPAITQIMQETIPENERYSVNAAQTVFCEFFSIVKDILVVLFPTTTTFGALIIISCCFVFAGYVFYISYFLSNFRFVGSAPTEEELKEMKAPEQERLIAANLVDRALQAA